MGNPTSEDQTQQDDNLDAAALFNTLASQDSDDSKQESEQTLENEGNELSNDDSEENNEGNADPDQTDEDPWLQVDETLRNNHYTLQANHSKLENDHKANAGRVQALNNKVKELTELVKNSESNGKQTGEGMPTADDLDGKSFAEVEEEWPEIAGYMKEKIANEIKQAQESMQSQINEQLTPINEMREQQSQREQQQYVQSERQRLQQVHPDFDGISKDPTFHNWVNAQPDTVKAMARSMHAADNIVLLNLYKGTANKKSPPSNSKLKDHAVIPKKGSGRRIQNDPNNLDPVALFAEIAARKGKK